MPPKKRTKQTKKMDTPFTLKQALDYIQSLSNPDTTKLNWTSSLSTLVHYNEEGENAFPTDLTKAEMATKYADVNLIPLLTNPDKVINIVQNEIKSSRSNNNIAIDSQKQYWLSLIRISDKGSALTLPKEARDVYIKQMKEADKSSNAKRNLNEPKAGNLLHPEFTWTVAQDELEKFLTETSFTNTKSGRTNLRNAVLSALYVLHNPRRIEDYCFLQYYSKKPTDNDLNDRNVIYKDDKKLYFSIDVFKTRMRVVGSAKQPKEVLPRYVKELTPKLQSLFEDYFKRFNTKDMAKLTTQQKRQKTQFYVFHLEDDDEAVYSPNTFSKVVSNAFKAVYKKNKLTVNTFRHIFANWITDNFNHFNDAQMGEFAISVGDTARVMPTNLRYRIQHQENKDYEKTEIMGNIQGNEYARRMYEAQAEEGGSVGQVDEPNTHNLNQDDNEVQSAPPITDESLESLYSQLGRAVYEVDRLKNLINKKLNMSV